MSNQYAQRDAAELDSEGGYYMRHVMAMTREGLHSKADIAAELGHRDRVIDALKAEITLMTKAFADMQAACEAASQAVDALAVLGGPNHEA